MGQGARRGPIELAGFKMVDEGRLSILVAEDDEVTQEILSRVLARHGWTVLSALDGEQAERMLTEHSPDVALLDVHLPFRSGFELLRLAKTKLGSQIKVVMVTATGQECDKERAYGLGADWYLVKPIDVKALPRIIEELIAEKR